MYLKIQSVHLNTSIYCWSISFFTAFYDSHYLGNDYRRLITFMRRRCAGSYSESGASRVSLTYEFISNVHAVLMAKFSKRYKRIRVCRILAVGEPI